jgi:hypothetical protein
LVQEIDQIKRFRDNFAFMGENDENFSIQVLFFALNKQTAGHSKQEFIKAQC